MNNPRAWIFHALVLAGIGALFFFNRDDSSSRLQSGPGSPSVIQTPAPGVSPSAPSAAGSAFNSSDENETEDRLQYQELGNHLGWAIQKPEADQLSELNEIFECSVENARGKISTYYSASIVCDGYGPHGKATGLYLAKRLIDSRFAPLQLCHTPEVALYNTLRPECDHAQDRINGVVGYVRLKR